MRRDYRADERGMVLLIVLLIVTLLVTILIEFSFSTLVDLRLAETYRDSTRAYFISKGGIRVGRIILRDDRNSYDGEDELWAQGIESYPVAEGTVSIRVEDLGGRLDLNRLVTPQGNIDPLFKDRFLRLLDLLGAEAPESLADALIDWMDADDDQEPAGAEDYYYQSLEDPYNCKNGPLDNLQELRLVRGYDSDLFRKLAPHVTAYGLAKININTASLEVLQSVSAEMDLTTAQSIIDYREAQPFTSMTQLQQMPGMETMYGFIYLYVDVKSSSYMIESTAFVNDGRRTIYAAFDKDDNLILYKRVL